MSSVPRLGRPPATDSVETRARILDVARRLFAAKGYAATSNRALAEEAGLTTGAIYHYFDRKLDIFTAVYEDVQDIVYGRFAAETAGSSSFIESLRRVLEASHDLDNQDPSLAQFLGSCRVDAERDPALADALRNYVNEVRRNFFSDMVKLGVRTGEIDVADVDRITVLLRTVTVGLVNSVSGRREVHRQAVDAIVSLFEGKLVRPPVD